MKINERYNLGTNPFLNKSIGVDMTIQKRFIDLILSKVVEIMPCILEGLQNVDILDRPSRVDEGIVLDLEVAPVQEVIGIVMDNEFLKNKRGSEDKVEDKLHLNLGRKGKKCVKLAKGRTKLVIGEDVTMVQGVVILVKTLIGRFFNFLILDKTLKI
jgi:hypothetical protein